MNDERDRHGSAPTLTDRDYREVLAAADEEQDS